MAYLLKTSILLKYWNVTYSLMAYSESVKTLTTVTFGEMVIPRVTLEQRIPPFRLQRSGKQRLQKGPLLEDLSLQVKLLGPGLEKQYSSIEKLFFLHAQIFILCFTYLCYILYTVRDLFFFLR